MKILLFITIVVQYLFNNPTYSGAVQLNSQNIDSVLAENELVLINFYADWCRFSNMLAPIWDSAADSIVKEFDGKKKVVVGKVDCDDQKELGSRFKISKYPTLKYFRHGVPAKKEYRGTRTAEAILKFATEQLKDSVTEFKDLQEVQKLEDGKQYIIGYFVLRDGTEHKHFLRAASSLKEDCHFHAGFGEVVEKMHPPGQSIVSFRSNKATTPDDDESFTGNLQSGDELIAWITNKCTPIVREITFENAEELTEEGLPFLILFYHPDDKKSIKEYSTIVQDVLVSERQSINFLIADGLKFKHPLSHLNKTPQDLPLIAIDSFRHMYLFDKYENMFVQGKLTQFIQDLHSGKLHREFHYGPDPTSTDDSVRIKGKASPPPSQFQHLKPSNNRYTLLHDEF